MASVPARRRLVIRIEGGPHDEGFVRLADFLDRLDAFRNALRQTERAAGRSGAYFRVVHLSQRSPATVELEEVRPEDTDDLDDSISEALLENLLAIRRSRPGAPPPVRDMETLEAYQHLVPTSENVSKVTIRAKRKRIDLDRSYAVKLAAVVGPDHLERGSVSGILERVNVHNEARFDIYPISGPHRIRCNFKRHRAALLDKVGKALGHKVTVIGQLRFKQWADQPHAVDAEDLEVHPLDSTLPRLRDLVGMAPQATGSMSVDEFIASIRHGSE